MAGGCEVCGKTTTFGRNIRHKHSGRWQRKAPKTSRTFQANVHKQVTYVNRRPQAPGHLHTLSAHADEARRPLEAQPPARHAEQQPSR